MSTHPTDPAAIAEQLKPRIDRNVAVLRALTFSASAEPSYDLLSDAVLWDDEVPADLSDEVRSVIRHIVRTRIDLAQHGGSDPTWEHLKKQAPAWPGFRPDRNGPELLALFAQGRENMQVADE